MWLLLQLMAAAVVVSAAVAVAVFVCVFIFDTTRKLELLLKSVSICFVRFRTFL